MPDVGAMLAWSMLARLPVGMVPLALIFVVRGQGGSYGQAGLVVAAYSVPLAAVAPYAGRRVDRVGPRRVILLRGIAYPGLLGGLAALALVGAPVLALAPVAAAAGGLLPPVAATMRTLWSRLVVAELRSTAYALDAALQEVFFVAGPLLVALLAIAAPVLALLGAALAAAVGTLGFVRVPAVAAARVVERGHDRRLGALGFEGMRTIVLLAAAWGVAFGIVEVATPAFAEHHGGRALAGVALAAFAGGSLAGGLVAGLRAASDERRRLFVAALGLAVALALPLLAGSIGVYSALLFLAGVPVAPAVAAAYGLTDKVVLPGSHAEAFAWIGTAVVSGIALGSALGGWLVDLVGVREALAVAALAAAAGFGLSLLRRRSLLPLD